MDEIWSLAVFGFCAFLIEIFDESDIITLTVVYHHESILFADLDRIFLYGTRKL